MYDVIIIGAGPAGLTAAIYCARAGLKAAVLEKLVAGGQMTLTYEVSSYPGYNSVTGFELSTKMAEQAQELGAEIISAEVLGLEAAGEIKRVICEDETYEARAIIFAGGGTYRHLGCEGEEALIGHGVAFCATCDGGFYKKRPVAVVGGGNTALEDALYLSNICEKVYLIHRRNEFRAEKRLVDKARAAANIELLTPYAPVRINGEKKVESMLIAPTDGGQERLLNVAAVFVAVGTNPQTELLKGILELDGAGYVAAPEDCKTSVNGLFVAGDIRRKTLYQIITAAADGATAADSAIKYLG